MEIIKSIVFMRIESLIYTHKVARTLFTSECIKFLDYLNLQ